MDNLLPSVPSVDVQSSSFRETTLPYQQWDAKRTHHAPSTPSDVRHLLPPIARRDTKPECGVGSQIPLPGPAEPQLPCPPPLNRHLTGLYDPSFDPSPIGLEERGTVQPVRISRVLPDGDVRQGAPSPAAVAAPLACAASVSSPCTLTVVNGYSHLSPCEGLPGGDVREQDDEGQETRVDVFVQGSSKTIEHTNLCPMQTLRIQFGGGSSLMSDTTSPNISGIFSTSSKIGEEAPLGLTIFLASASKWAGLDDRPHTSDRDGTDESGGEGRRSVAHRPRSRSRHPESWADVAKSLVLCSEDGRPAPSNYVMRLQFEPGPLGMEVEENPDEPEVVQVRQVLQAGQADHDGRVHPGSLIVAVDDWGKGATDPVRRTVTFRDKAPATPSIIRSLAGFEEAILRRRPDQLFTVWVIDRHAPPVVAVLGTQHGEEGAKFSRTGSSRALSRHNAGSEEMSPAPSADQGIGVNPSWRSASTKPFRVESRSRELLQVSSEDLEASLGWGQARMEDGLYQHGNSATKGDDMRQIPILGARFEKWEFETGGGIFDEDDQGLAPRRGPRRRYPSETQGSAPESEQPRLPLGLQASAADDVTVFIRFCNNHASADMQVSWIDYGGNIVFRRTLAPGDCYFEQSFATHPWLIRTINGSTRRSDKQSAHETGGGRSPEQTGKRISSLVGQAEGDCCVVRLGETMAATAGLTGSLIWNPARRTLSVTKQAKVSTPGRSVANAGVVGSVATDGAGIDPGKKRVCSAGADRPAEAERAAVARAAVRNQKVKILEEMRAWRTYPAGGVCERGNGAAAAAVGVSAGAPNLRFVMIGSP